VLVLTVILDSVSCLACSVRCLHPVPIQNKSNDLLNPLIVIYFWSSSKSKSEIVIVIAVGV